MTSKFCLVTALLLFILVPIAQVANAASIEVPKYGIDELMPEEGLVPIGIQTIEYPDGQTKIEIPYKDEDKKAWINVEAYEICVQEDRELTREAGLLPEQQSNETVAKEAAEALEYSLPLDLDSCIEFNGRYAEVYEIPN
jgi:hypothetical protein